MDMRYLGYRGLAIVFLTLLPAGALVRAQEDRPASGDWAPLFNGQNLDEWVRHGGEAKYSVEDGQIVGRTVPNTPDSFLCSKKEYGDFILELDFKVDEELNSGVNVRSHCLDVPTTAEWQGKTIRIPANRVHGYQVEIDPSERAWSGGIYDEGRRGWLNDLQNNEAARKAFKSKQWNHLRIECRGDSIKTWLNDVPAADLHDSMTPTGFVALQVHSVRDKTEPLEVRWRNMRIQELTK